MFREELEHFVVDEMSNCIGCNECMKACPVTKSPDLTIAMLNDAVTSESEPKGIVKEFTLNCVQCGRCVPVCPPGVRRDLMVLYTKSKIKSYPRNYDSYVRLKQPHPPAAAKALYGVKKRLAKNGLGTLYEKLDTENLRQAELLFYPGCYIFNQICHKTVAIMDYLKEDYEILGGYSTCCGWPQYLQGRLEMADEFMANLWRLIQKVNPKRIITSCAECFAALRKLKALYNAEFIPLTTTEYFLQNVGKFKFERFEKTMGFHDSCHISRKFRHYAAPREMLEKLGEVKELTNHHEQTTCCYYYNFENDPNNRSFRADRAKEVKKNAQVMVCDCITCYEVYKEKLKDPELEVWDINELVYHCAKLTGADVEGKNFLKDEDPEAQEPSDAQSAGAKP